MWISYREIDRRNSCFLALGLKPRCPMKRIEKFKAFLFGRVFKRSTNR
jgi:hypothetical protein